MVDTVQNILQELLGKMGVADAKLILSKDDANKFLRVEIETADPSLLIGWHGETINALQHLAKSILRTKNLMGDYFLVLDVDNYKQKQQENIIELAERKAENVLETGIGQFLPPMSPFFRKLVHMHFANNPKFQAIATESIGEGDERQVKISRKEG